MGEYIGKHVLGFIPSTVEPILGKQMDLAVFTPLLSVPLDPEAYVKQQVMAFNRLYNNQLYKYYHSAGIRIESELKYGIILPSVTTLYNFTSRDMLLMPEVRIKPYDGLTLTAGMEIYSGRKGSLFDIVNDFLNGAYASLRVDF
jgi:hypothetical protein